MIAPRFIAVSRMVRSCQTICSLALLLGMASLGIDRLLHTSGLV